MTVQYDDKRLWTIIFQLRGSVWIAVLPYCIFNCFLTYLVTVAKKKGVSLAFSPEGHSVVGLLVSFLVINKVYLALDRYMQARAAMGHALSSLRELNQNAIVLTELQTDEAAQKWRKGVQRKTIDVIDCIITVVKESEDAIYLARNEGELSKSGDPMSFVQVLRSHLYNCQTLTVDLQLLERMKMMDQLNAFSFFYRDLLKIASTPLPFPLIQMARTFLFLWMFSMPLALAKLEFELFASMEFVFFLTYGYIGLEFVAMQLLQPFGDGINDINVTGMRNACVLGILKDSNVGDPDGDAIYRKKNHVHRFRSIGDLKVQGVEELAAAANLDDESPYHCLGGWNSISNQFSGVSPACPGMIL